MLKKTTLDFIYFQVFLVICIALVLGISSADAAVVKKNGRLFLDGKQLPIYAKCRDSAVKKQFDRQQGYPNGRKGYIVDHVCALANGGLDVTRNMQYQTKADSKAKDKVENTPFGKKKWCTKKNSLLYRTVYNCK